MLDALTQLPARITGRTRALVERIDERSDRLGELIGRGSDREQTPSALDAVELDPEAPLHHVRPAREGGWVVDVDGSKEPVRRFSTRLVAVELARERARRAGGTVVVHELDGGIEAVEPGRAGEGA